MYHNPHPSHYNLCQTCGGHGVVQADGTAHCSHLEHCLDKVTDGVPCPDCGGNTSASGRLVGIDIDASGPCPTCGGGQIVPDPDYPGTTKLLGAHIFGKLVQHNGCDDCDGSGRASGRAFVVWHEYTQEEHDAAMEQKRLAQEAEDKAAEAKKLQDEQDERDKAILRDSNSSDRDLVLASARLNRYL